MDKKEKRRLPCVCIRETCDHWFAYYDHLEYAKALRVGPYKRCSGCSSWCPQSSIEAFIIP